MSTLLCCLCLAVLQADTPPDPAKLLELLRQRDAAFDNACLQYVKMTRRVMPYMMNRFGEKGGDEKVGPARPPGSVYHTRDRVSFTVRKDEATILWEHEGQIPPLKGEYPIKYQKHSSANGQWREIMAMKDRSDGIPSNVVTIQKARPDALRETRMFLSFSFGFGYGKQITRIDKITPHPVGWQVEGGITVYKLDTSTFRIVMDKDFIVREAEIDVIQQGHHQYKMAVKTEGRAATKDVTLAQTGHVRKWWPAVYKDGKLTRPEVTREDVKVEFLAYKPNLTDDEYKKLIDFDLPNNSQINDHIQGDRLHKDADGKVRFVERLKPTRP